MYSVTHKFYAAFFALTCFLIGFPGVSMAALDHAKEPNLSAHKALYDLRLSSKKSSSKVSNISGKMFYEWQPSCDAWISNHRFDMMYEYPEVPAMRLTSEFSTYESFDGKSFDFTSQRKNDGEILEELRGHAAMANDGEGEATYTIPKDLVFGLPKGTLFPTAHTLDVLKKIKEGKKFYQATLFDGSDEEGPVAVNVFVGKEVVYKPPVEFSADIDPTLIVGKAWNIRLAFFPLNNFEASSDYEMSVVFHENGVISDMTIDYDDFSMSQKLIAIQPLGDACHNSPFGDLKEIQENLKK